MGPDLFGFFFFNVVIYSFSKPFQNTLFERKVTQPETWHNLYSSLTISIAAEDKLYPGIWSQTHIDQWNPAMDFSGLWDYNKMRRTEGKKH